MKNISTSLLLLALLVLLSCNTSKKFTLDKMPEAQPLAETKAILSTLASDEMQGRNVGTAGIEKAAVYIENYLKRKKLMPFFGNSYRDGFDARGNNTNNIVAWIKGSDAKLQNEYILIGAHYDHLGMLESGDDLVYNGANDNASGVTATLQIAAFIADKNPKRSVIIALFSAEEKGLLGSTHLAERLKKQNLDIKCMFNLEMLGKTLSDKPTQVYITGYKKSNMATTVNKILNEPFVQYLESENKYALFYRSDNFPFFKEFTIPAHTFSTFDFTNYPYYHHTKDEVEELDLENMNRIIHKLSFVIMKFANTARIGVEMKE